MTGVFLVQIQIIPKTVVLVVKIIWFIRKKVESYCERLSHAKPPSTQRKTTTEA
jgi:hypothetical protein